MRAKLAHVGYLIVLKYRFCGGQETSSVEMTEEGPLKDSPSQRNIDHKSKSHHSQPHLRLTAAMERMTLKERVSTW